MNKLFSILLTSFFTIPTFGGVPSKQFTLPPLPYAYNALEPYMDEETMHIHHDKHHQKYVDDLNTALKAYPELYDKTIAELVSSINSLPSDIQTPVRKFGGGHYNHSFFWEVMAPNKGGLPKESLNVAIKRDFGSFDNFKTQFSQVATQTFGSGWTFLVKNPEGKLEILSTSNQDTPLEKGLTPIITIDLWEHAYYLKYQNKRADYIANFFNLIDWDKAETRYLTK